jgi:ribosomal protein S18 acetylase RimI-like enzyme
VRPHGSIINDERLQAMQPELLYAQQEMIAKNPPQFDVNTLPPVQFRLATVEDIPLVAKMGTVSFNSKFTDNMTRFTENMQEKVRKIWLVSTSEHENVGKIHVRFDDNQTAFLHDLCIAPEFRGQDLAKAMIMQMMDMLRKQGQRVIALDVECDNTNALALYDRCGFVSVGAYDYLRIANRFFF